MFSIVSSDHLVLLARTSFTGTAFMGPMILVGLFSKEKRGNFLPVSTLVALILFVGSQIGLVPGRIGILELELVLFLVLAGIFLWEMKGIKAR